MNEDEETELCPSPDPHTEQCPRARHGEEDEVGRVVVEVAIPGADDEARAREAEIALELELEVSDEERRVAAHNAETVARALALDLTNRGFRCDAQSEEERVAVATVYRSAMQRWFDRAIPDTLSILDDIMANSSNEALKMQLAKDILAIAGTVSPLDKVPSNNISVSQQNVIVDPRISDALDVALSSMKVADQALVGSLLPIDRIAESRYIEFSEASISEPAVPHDK